MTDIETLTHNGEDDYLPDESLDLVLDELVAKLPDGFDLKSTQGYSASVTCALSFPVHGPIAQVEQLELILKSATMIGTVARNLRHRNHLAAELMEAIGHWRDELSGHPEWCEEILDEGGCICGLDLLLTEATR